MKENKNDMFEISRDDIVRTITQNPRFSANGINLILDRQGIVALLGAIMYDIDSLSRRAEYYKESYSCRKELLDDQSAYIDELEEELKQLRRDILSR